MGHRESKTSTGKKPIELIKLKYALISYGKDNKFNHPNKSVLDNLSASKIYRTDQAGSIMFEIKNNKIKIKNYTS